MFAVGELLHGDIQVRASRRHLLESGRDIEYGIEDLETEMTGRLDLLAAVWRFVKAEQGIAVIEIKTKNPYAFAVEEPTSEEVDQLLLYIGCLKKSAARGVRKIGVLDYGFILYVDRAMMGKGPYLAGWKVYFDAERVEKIKARFHSLAAAIGAGDCPLRPYERDSIKCQYCRFAEFCWRGVPKADEPALVADGAEPPEQELVESMAARYVELKAREAETKAEIEKAAAVLTSYFKAKGVTEIPGAAIEYASRKETVLDVPFLYSKLRAVWYDIAVPQIKLIQAAIKAGKVDPEIFERAKVVDYSWFIRVKKNKGGKDADQGIV
jgi:CRISPR/Cas system-associated exonuclease Cas4 (RecB family)